MPGWGRLVGERFERGNGDWGTNRRRDLSRF